MLHLTEAFGRQIHMLIQNLKDLKDYYYNLLILQEVKLKLRE